MDDRPLIRVAYWTSATTWCDPDCIECGGEGAPCCDPPDHPPTGRRAWLLWHGAQWFADLGYRIRPYDMLADRRRWFALRIAQRCGWGA